MGCVNTKKQTKDEDKKKEEKKEEETAPEQNGAVDKAEEGAAAGDVEVAVTADGDKSCDSDLAAWRQDALKIHNRQRALHGVPPLELREDLNESAQRWAENIAKKNMLQHTPAGERKINGEMFGENLAHKNFGSSDQAAVDAFNPTAEDMVMMWYNESKDPGFEYGKADMQPSTGHFTQVVWKNSTAFGIGKVRVQEGNAVNVYVCAQYIPAGNFQGEFADNVPPLKS